MILHVHLCVEGIQETEEVVNDVSGEKLYCFKRFMIAKFPP